VWCRLYQEVWDWREGEAKRREMTRVQYVECGRRDIVGVKITEQERKKILCSEYKTE